MKFNFTKKAIRKIDEDYLEVDVQYPEKLVGLHDYIIFLPERLKIEKVEKLVANSHDKTEWKKAHRVIQVNWNAWPKPILIRILI